MRAWHFWCQAQLQEFSFPSGETMHIDRDGCAGFIQVIDQHQNTGLSAPSPRVGGTQTSGLCIQLTVSRVFAGRKMPSLPGPLWHVHTHL